MNRLSLIQVQALSEVALCAEFDLATHAGAAANPDDAERRVNAREARRLLLEATRKAATLEVDREQVNRIIDDANRALIAAWAAEPETQAAAVRAKEIFETEREVWLEEQRNENEIERYYLRGIIPPSY